MVCAPVFELMVKLGGGVPVPFNVVDCGDPEALSVTCKLAEKPTADAAVNVT
jgi:hypothetical protein